jgi:hypothetical protein
MPCFVLLGIVGKALLYDSSYFLLDVSATVKIFWFIVHYMSKKNFLAINMSYLFGVPIFMML